MPSIPSFNRKTVKQKITNELRKQIQDLAGVKSKAEIAAIVGRSENSVQRIASAQGFSLRVKNEKTK